ncbi:hypothetical protein Ssi03_34410 [Sphaerisporangium siamense]|uniref:Anti-sigma regulatory factor (Ser/Thr protein kinase) n=1 Tax=Sphaerisporangium siamense TaxID=795645 RepID=A0A7W7D1B2_9ACTN|nr:ATP-binding protein [Sphaerisporangium siamense]MBB4698489.1 anti-sigma regulatory factor (Ser/Thr protein kinase) [Sphaerisporangium siamense]GII85451.1 hypothetical protein Ssi03_34410 [Sphaerisporangium siamense]
MAIQMAMSGHDIEQDGDIPLLGQKWIPADEKCIASARRFVRDVALDWKAADKVPAVAELLTSEVVTNALVHGMKALPVSSTIRIAVRRDGSLMTVEVYDSCVTIPRMRSAESMETSGRGLAIVQALACKWGWILHHHGKTVWFHLTAWPQSDPSVPLKLLP